MTTARKVKKKKKELRTNETFQEQLEKIKHVEKVEKVEKAEKAENKSRMYGVLAHQLVHVWSDVEPLIESALQYSDGKYAVGDIYKALTERDMQLWMVFNDFGLQAVFVTQIINYPQKRVFYLLFVAGKEVQDWIHFSDDLADFGKEHGCSTFEAWGRAGWEKLGIPHEFEKIYTVFRRAMN